MPSPLRAPCAMAAPGEHLLRLLVLALQAQRLAQPEQHLDVVGVVPACRPWHTRLLNGWSAGQAARAGSRKACGCPPLAAAERACGRMHAACMAHGLRVLNESGTSGPEGEVLQRVQRQGMVRPALLKTHSRALVAARTASIASPVASAHRLKLPNTATCRVARTHARRPVHTACPTFDAGWESLGPYTHGWVPGAPAPASVRNVCTNGACVHKWGLSGVPLRA